MASFLYASARNSFAMGYFKWRRVTGDTFRAFCVIDSHAPNKEGHKYLSDIPTTDLCGTGGNTNISDAVKLDTLDPVDGVCDANNIIFSGIPAGKHIRYILIFKDTGDVGTSDLVALCDVTGDRPPIITNSADLGFNFSDTPSKIFKL
jgi:hypothetical protein